MLYLFIASFALALIYLGTRYFLRVDREVGGARVITCPETKRQATVEVNARRAALTSLIGQERLELESCSRWPLRQDCGQECLLQLDVAPADCLVSSVLVKWYRGKKCAFCHRGFDEIGLIDHKPALLKTNGETAEWSQIEIAEAEHAMETCQPVCWDCHIAQTFQREHPDLVVIRPPLDVDAEGHIKSVSYH